MEVAVRGVAQRRRQVPGNQRVEAIEAFTRKSDGRIIPADPRDFSTQNGILSDAASFVEVKIEQVAFRDLSAGDTTVLTLRTTERDHYIPGQYAQELLCGEPAAPRLQDRGPSEALMSARWPWRLLPPRLDAPMLPRHGGLTWEAAVTIADMHALNADQITYWNGAGGRRWTDRQELQDAVLAPVSELLFARAEVERGERVIDIGCGCGSTAIELARRVGPTGSVVGVDVSVPMLARARERVLPGMPVEFVEADATVYRFPPARTDLVCSRFGVMFFAQPTLSFANMRTALRSGGRAVFVCWRAPEENPWITLPLKEVYKHVPPLPESGPEDPGPFSFANADRVHRILDQAGFSAIALEPVDFFIDLATGRGLDGALATALEVGPASRALEGQSPESREKAAGSIRAALAPFQQGEAVPLAAAIWIVTANNR